MNTKMLNLIFAMVVLLTFSNFGLTANSQLPDLIAELESEDWVIKRDTIIDIGNLGPAASDAIPILEKYLYDDIWTIRDSTARTLGKIGTAAVPVLTTALDHEDSQTLQGVVRALEEIGPEATTAVGKLKELLNSDNTSLLQGVIKTLGAIGTGAQTVAGEVALFLGHPDIMVSFAARQTIAKITRESLVEPLLNLILDPEQPIQKRMAGIKALETIGEQEEAVIIGMNEILTSEEKLLRWMGASTVGKLKPQMPVTDNILKALFKLLDDEVWFVRSAALNTLRNLNSQLNDNAILLLENHLTTGNNLQRLVAAELLAVVEDDATTETLKKQLQMEQDDDVVIAITRTLRHQGMTNFDFLSRTDIEHLINSVRTEPAVVKLIGMLDNEGKTILEAQNMTKEEYIAYKAWESSTTIEEMQTLYKDYQYEVDSTDVMHGAFKNSIDIRSQEGTYTLAYLYQEPLSRYYQNEHVLNSVLRSLDYMTRAQGSNGGFVDGGREWPGVPNRSHAYDPVAGFTLYSMSRSMVILSGQPAFQEALEELIDAEGLGKPHITRRDAWITMLANAGKWITYEQRGHGPNQDVGNVVSAFTINEAHKLLHENQLGTLSKEELDKLTQQCMSSTTWWTEQGMLKERNGPDPAGYDGHYGSVTQYWLGLLTMYHPDAKVRMEKYLNTLQYFYYPAGSGSYQKAYQIEGVTANRRRMEKGADIVALSVSYKYHPAVKPIYYSTFEALKANPRLDFPGGSHTFSESLYKYVDFMEYGQIPQESNYAIPAEVYGPWIYLDPTARALAAKTEEGHLIYVSLAAKRFDEPAPYHVVGQKQGTFYLNPERKLDQQVVQSTQPYAYDIQFSPIKELEADAWELIYSLIEEE